MACLLLFPPMRLRSSSLFPYTTLFRSQAGSLFAELTDHEYDGFEVDPETYDIKLQDGAGIYGMRRFSGSETDLADRKSTRLNSSHRTISYAVFCLKKKSKKKIQTNRLA